MTAKKKNFAAYKDALGIVHPIRSGQQKVATKRGPKFIEAKTPYNEFAAGDYDDPKMRKQKRERYESMRDRAYYAKLERSAKGKRELRGARKDLGSSLAQFVRRSGGIAPARNEVFRGELARLSRKESGRTGLVNRNNRKAGSLVTADRMRELAEEDGFGHFYSVGAFLDAVEADASGKRKTYNMANPKRKTNRTAVRRQTGAPLFSSLAIAQARKVQRISKVKREDTGTEGRVIGRSGDWFKVKFSGYDRPHYVKEDALIFLNPTGRVRLKLGARKQTTKPNGLFGRVVAKRKLRKARRRAALAGVDAQMASEDLRAARRKKKPNPKTATAKRTANKSNPEITPARARQLLKTNVGNRPIDAKKVTAIASVMKRGIFKRLKPIVFTNGILTDGQHTLLAVVKAGVPVRMKISHKRVKPNPLFADILGGFAGGAGYAIASHVTARELDERRRKRRGGGAVVDATVNPSKRAKRARKNPPPSGVGSLHKEFQGRGAGKFDVLETPPGAPRNLCQLGVLKELRIANGQLLNFTSPRARLCADGKGNLFIAGVRYKDNPSLDMGLVESVTYDTRKNHLHGGKRFFFEHKMGEAGGRRPRLVITNGYPKLIGGSYKIGWPGIIN